MESFNFFTEESNESIDLVDSLHVIVASEHKNIHGKAEYYIGGDNIDEIEIILKGISAIADDADIVNEIVDVRCKKMKQHGFKRGFKEDVELLLFCANSKEKQIRLLALTILKKMFGLEVGWNASEFDEQHQSKCIILRC